jgi:ankyrin repeat protein
MQNALHLITESKKIHAGGVTSSSTQSNTPREPNKSVVLDSSWLTSKSKTNELNLKLAKTLIYSGCDLNHKDLHSHETPIFRAILANNYELVKFFVAEGVDMSARNLFGNDVLSRSIQLGRFRIARLLIVADSPIRVYSCIYRIPNVDDLNRDLSKQQNEAAAATASDEEVENNDIDLDASEVNSENFLQYSIGKYEEFLTFLQTYTQQPRSLLDLSRLCVRNQMHKPISKSLAELGKMPKQIFDLIMLKDIDKRIEIDFLLFVVFYIKKN